MNQFVYKEITRQVSEILTRHGVGHSISSFQDYLASAMKNHDLEIMFIHCVGDHAFNDLINFCWWSFKGDHSRVEDFYAGIAWPISGSPYNISPDSSFAEALEADPLSAHTRQKLKDYVKHIGWIYHKTQNLPNLVIYGSDTVPERAFGLRQCQITRLNPKDIIPPKTLFNDHIQARNFHELVDTRIGYADLSHHDSPLPMLYEEPKNLAKYVKSQNVFILDDGCSAYVQSGLSLALAEADCLLTPHGRVLFDLIICGDEIAYSQPPLWSLFGPYNYPIAYPSSDTAIAHVVESVEAYNIAAAEKDSLGFEIEDLKISFSTYANAPCGLRVYLKKFA